MSDKFLYFAYASNLSSDRLLRNNPSAVRVGIAKLNNYQLNFDLFSKRWRGASATIVENKNSYIWGALWELDENQMEILDKQEGVLDGLYVALNLDVQNPNGEIVNCRLYQQSKPPRIIDDIRNLPEFQKPSLNYLNIILKGAQESELPAEYQQFLRTIPDNGYDGEYDIDLPLSAK